MTEDLSGFSMLELFRLETESQTSVLADGILAIEQGRHDAETIDSMMRAAHSLKGAARIVGVAPAESVAHALEDRLIAVGRDRASVDTASVDRLLAAVDFLGRVAGEWQANAPDGAWNDEAGRIVAGLETLGIGRPATGEPSHRSPNAPPTPAPPAPASDAQGVAPVPTPARSSGEPAIPKRTAGKDSVASAAERDRTAASGPARPSDDATDRVVRVSADSLTRLVGLAGESLVEARLLRPFVDSLVRVREAHLSLCDDLAELRGLFGGLPGPRADGIALPAGTPLPGWSPQAEAIGQERLERACRRAEEMLAELGRRIEGFESFARRNEDLAGRLHHEIIASRMRPLADGIRGLPRLVRDLARTLGKQARLVVAGGQTGVDRDILDSLEATLAHLVRNAIDHGLESPSERLAAGKAAEGTIRIEAGHRAGMLTISVADDGRGVGLEALRRSIVDKGLAPEEVARRLGEQELLEFLFLPGFSTRGSVTEISGRGVGLDAVQTMAKSVGGGIRITTVPGRSTAFLLQLPITMSVIRAVLVAVRGEPYAFPLTRIDRICFVEPAALGSIEGRQFFDLDGTAIGLVPASQVLGFGPVDDTPADPLPIVVVSDRGRRFGLIVDTVLGERDLDVRPLDPRLGKVPDIASASLLENGDPVLIVDTEDLVRSIENLLAGGRPAPIVIGSGDEPTPSRRRRILVVDDSITVRELERQLLESRGYDVDVAIDGMDGWNSFRSGEYDLVVSDVDMPRLDGIGLVKLIRSDTRRGRTPVVIVSYKDREEDRLRGLDAGADRYLTKGSFHDETFLATVAALAGDP
jgi:two-component system sensor histidine kinase and response regulator WspE